MPFHRVDVLAALAAAGNDARVSFSRNADSVTITSTSAVTTLNTNTGADTVLVLANGA